MLDDLSTHILRNYGLAFDELVERGMILDSNGLVPFLTHKLTTLSWSADAKLSYLFGDYYTIEHYCEMLTRRDFCFIFSDGGLVQINYEIEESSIKKHRLSYIPCPYSFNSEDLEIYSLAELPTVYSGDELRRQFRLTTPIRFDFDADFADERHDYSHVTLNKESCRLPAYGPVSLGHFFRFILRYFYESEFTGLNDWDELQPRIYRRTLRHPPIHELHLDTAAKHY